MPREGSENAPLGFIEGGLAPGGVVVDVWLDGELARRTLLRPEEADRAEELGERGTRPGRSSRPATSGRCAATTATAGS